MARHNQLGQWGEQLAREHLRRQGYTVCGQNVKIGNYEIDFIATKDDRIAFCEVKTRSTDLVDPLEAVDRRKQSRLVRAADEYLRANRIRHLPQFDIITIIGTPETGHRLEHIPDAFFPPLRTR